MIWGFVCLREIKPLEVQDTCYVSASNTGETRWCRLGNKRHPAKVGNCCCCWKPDTMLAATECCYHTRRQRDSTPPQHRLLRAVFELEPQQPLPAKVVPAVVHVRPQSRGKKRPAWQWCAPSEEGGAGLESPGERSASGCTGRAGVGKGGELPKRMATRCAAEGSVLSHRSYKAY